MSRPIINNKIPLGVDQDLKNWYKRQEKEAYKLVDKFRQKIAGAARGKRKKVPSKPALDSRVILTDNPTSQYGQIELSDAGTNVS